MKARNKYLLALLLFVATAASAQNAIPKWKITDLERELARSDKPTVVNFWATFCKPCIAEIPYFQELVKKYDSAGVRLMLVSLDLPDDYAKIPAFAQKRKFTAPIYFLDESNADYFCPKVDPKWSGAIPATLFVNAKTGYRAFFEDALPAKKFEEQLRKMITAR